MAKLSRKDKARLAALGANATNTASLSSDQMLLQKSLQIENDKLKAQVKRLYQERAEESKSPLKIIKNQRKEISQLTTQNQKLEKQMTLLELLSENRKAVLAELYESLRLLQFANESICNDIPYADSLNFTQQIQFVKDMVMNLNSAFNYKRQYIEQIITHKDSEKNSRKSNVDLTQSLNDYGQILDDEQAKLIKAYGDEQLKSDKVATAQIPNDDVADDTSDIDILSDKTLIDSDTNLQEIQSLLLSKISQDNQQKDILDILTDQDDVIKDVLHEVNAHTQGNGNTVANRDAYIKPDYTHVKADNVIGVNKDERYIDAYCSACNKVHSLKLVNKVQRVNEVLTNKNGRIGKALLYINTAKCELTGKEVEINPVTFTDFDHVNNNLHKHDTELLNDVSDTVTERLTQKDSEQLYEHISESDKAQAKAVLEMEKSFSELVSEQGSQTVSAAHSDKRGEVRVARKTEANEIVKSPLAVIHKTKYSSHLITDDDGNEVISPNYVVQNDGAELPVFLKSCCSVGVIVDCACWFSFLSATKSKICKFLEGCGFDLGKGGLIALLNGFSRAYLNPVTKQIRLDMLTKCNSVLMDETTLKVREYTKDYDKANSYVWGMTTGFTESINAAWFKVSPNRSFTNVIDILSDDNISVQLKNLTADGFSGYDKGIEELYKNKNIKISLTRCFTHNRRLYHEFLENAGLLEVYRQRLLPNNAKFTDFNQNLIKYKNSEIEKINSDTNPNKEASLKLLDVRCSMLTIYYLINTLYVIDSKVIKSFNYNCNSEEFIAALSNARKQYSAKIVDAIFDSIKQLLITEPSLLKIRYNKKTDKMTFRQNRLRNESKALMYSLKFEKQLRLFVDDSTIELSQSAAERIMRTVVCSKQNGFEFIDSADGAKAFSDYMTIINTCMLNRVPVREYMLWLVANIKLRMQKLVASGYTDDTMYKIPTKKKMKDEKPGEYYTVDMYDKENHIAYDRLDMKGLTPYDYKSHVLREQNAI